MEESMSAAVDTPAATVLSAWQDQVFARLRASIDDACSTLPALREAVLDLVADTVPYRLLGMAVHAALTGAPAPAVPVCVVSRLWWAGAEALDDLSDGTSRPGRTPRPPGETLTAATACLVLLPQLVVDREELPDDVRRDWQRELIGSCLEAAEGQLTDMAVDDGDFSWSQVVASYRRKTGAPYARDAFMAARLATPDPQILHGWHAFGWLFGLLRQLHNDAVSTAPEYDEDLANGTRVLRLVYALEVCPPAQRDALLDLRERARTDTDARVLLRQRLDEPSVADGYRGRIDGMRQHACALIDHLAPPSSYRDLLHELVHRSYAGANPEHGGTKL
jgi:hypothetical protein